jgi:hypothetical protein
MYTGLGGNGGECQNVSCYTNKEERVLTPPPWRREIKEGLI